MSEELLKAIIQFFAIVAKERITDEERSIIKEFLSLHLNQDGVRYYLSLFDDFCKANKPTHANLTNVDEATQVFVGDDLSERQSNLIFYIGEALKIPSKDFRAMRSFVLGHDAEELEAKNILIIDEGSEVQEHQGPHLTAKNLSGMIAILRLTD